VSSFGPLPMLTANDLAYVAGPEVFTPLVNETLGNAGGPDDGFDSMFAAVASGYQADVDGLGELDTHITAADFNPGDFDATEAAPVALDIVTTGADVDNALSDFGAFSSTLPPLSKDPSAAIQVGSSVVSGNNAPVTATAASFVNAQIVP